MSIGAYVSFSGFGRAEVEDVREITAEYFLTSQYNSILTNFSFDYEKNKDPISVHLDKGIFKNPREIHIVTNQNPTSMLIDDSDNIISDAVAFGINLSRKLNNTQVIVTHDSHSVSYNRQEVALADNESALGLLQASAVESIKAMKRDERILNNSVINQKNIIYKKEAVASFFD